VINTTNIKDSTELKEKQVQLPVSLRDYFAAKAMQNMYANGSFPTGIMLDTAKEAYEMADAMLKAREA
jgi:hypothetical protein